MKGGVEFSEDGTGVLSSKNDAEDVKNLCHCLREFFDKPRNVKCTALTFDSNEDLHVAFVCATSNIMRQCLGCALNADTVASRLISTQSIGFHECLCFLCPTHGPPAHDAGLLAGLMCIELIKLLQNRASEDFLHSKVLLSQQNEAKHDVHNRGQTCHILTHSMPKPNPFVSPRDPMMSKVRAIPSGFTKWDKEVVKNGAMTCRQFINFISRKHSVEVLSIRCEAVEIYNQELHANVQSILDAAIVQRFEALSGLKLSPKCQFLYLDLACIDEDERRRAVMPVVKFFFR